MDGRNYFIFDGISSRDFDAYISGGGIFKSPETDYETIEVPGRSGDLHFSNKRYKNVAVTYNSFIIRDFFENFSGLKSALLARDSYCRLEDTYYPDRFRMAMIKGSIEPDMTQNLIGGSFTIEFDCKPQHYLKSGEHSVTLTSSGSKINNPGLPAKPLIKVYGSSAGTLTIGGTTVQIKSISSYVMLDCELQDAYKGTENKNSTVYAPEYPILASGVNTINWTGGVTKVEITPRWWVL